MKFYITGSTRGLGEYISNEFNCECFDRPDYDIATDVDNIVERIEPSSVVILNAHANQLEYVERLKNRCSLVVMGSIAAINFDPEMPEYSKEKWKLEKTVQHFSEHSKYPMLYLQLTSSSYRNYNVIVNSIKFWLDNPDVTFIGYNINE
jgi:hypothetical protein|tara:strand:+ start:548 stop:994 length:447 start_codon:yes stop_codon:yes gene_type:complete